MKLTALFFTIIGFLCGMPQESLLPKTPHELSGRIVGGVDATPGQFPWQVAVYYDTDEGSFFCGGALIDVHWVLTAAHCVYNAKIFTLRLGSNSLTDPDNNRVEYTVTHAVAHPAFNPNTLQNDIGLIRINSAVPLNEFRQTIPLGTAPVGGGVSVTVSGWGATGDWDGAVSYLKYVNLATITNVACQTIYGEFVDAGMLCAVGRAHEGTCSGDSGGPLMAVVNGFVVHVGVVSWASASGCETDHPSGYARTAYYADWIHSVIGH